MALKRNTETMPIVSTNKRVEVYASFAEAHRVIYSEEGCSADLGGSSSYSTVTFEDRSGEGFHVNII